jgi:uncharacterized protein
MESHATLVRRFYDRLAARDAAGAVALYHPEILYSDPLHPRLRGAAAAELWRMRLEEPGAYQLTLVEARAEAGGALARWTVREAVNGRTIVTHGRSLFAFRDGLVSRHYDHYSLWRRSAAALGPAGALLGWLGPFRWALRQRAARALQRFTARD